LARRLDLETKINPDHEKFKEQKRNAVTTVDRGKTGDWRAGKIQLSDTSPRGVTGRSFPTRKENLGGKKWRLTRKGGGGVGWVSKKAVKGEANSRTGEI